MTNKLGDFRGDHVGSGCNKEWTAGDFVFITFQETMNDSAIWGMLTVVYLSEICVWAFVCVRMVLK